MVRRRWLGVSGKGNHHERFTHLVGKFEMDAISFPSSFHFCGAR